MSNNSCIGINGVSRKIKKIYVGVNGVAREAKAVSIGVNGVARKCYAGTTTWKKYQAVGYYHYLGGYTKTSDKTLELGNYYPNYNDTPQGRFTGKDYVKQYVDTEGYTRTGRFVYLSETFNVSSAGKFELGSYTDEGEYRLDSGHTSLSHTSKTIYAVSKDYRYLAELKNSYEQSGELHYGDPYYVTFSVESCSAVYKINDEWRYKAGSYIGEVESDDETAYPDNGRHTDGYYYIKQN